MQNKEDTLRFLNNIQVLEVAFDGVIKKTDRHLFNWKVGSSIFKANPFFEVIRSISKNTDLKKREYTFPCVHLSKASKIKICDITIHVNPEEVVVVIFEYTSQYEELIRVLKQKNESLLVDKENELRNKFLSKQEEFKDNFIAKMYHKIKTPLTGVIGFTEILENTALSLEQKELVEVIKREGKHLKALVYDVLDIAKLEDGKQDAKYENFDFHKLIDDVEKRYKHLAREKNIHFEVHLDATIQKEIIGDEVKLRQILLSLLNNAFRFTSEGAIKLLVNKNHQRTNKLSINFKITDTGSGVSEENLEYVFNKHTALDEDNEILRTGLGLTSLKSLVHLLGGTIKVKSKLNQGSTFDINIPFKFKLTKQKKEKSARKYELPQLGRKFNILLVEDKEINQYIIMKMLISHGSFYLDVANDGDEAITYIEKKEYDLVIMDLMMSPVDGYKATHMIRNYYGDDKISKIPIIGFTASNMEGEREKCLKAGMDDFISKPFAREDLLNKIAKQIYRSKRP